MKWHSQGVDMVYFLGDHHFTYYNLQKQSIQFWMDLGRVDFCVLSSIYTSLPLEVIPGQMRGKALLSYYWPKMRRFLSSRLWTPGHEPWQMPPLGLGFLKGCSQVQSRSYLWLLRQKSTTVLVRDLNRNGALGRDLRIMSVMGILSRPFLFVLLSELGCLAIP